MKLLLDLGNTRLKWALAEGPRLRSTVTALAWEEPGFEAHLDALLAGLPPVEAVWWASVAAPAREAQVLGVLRARREGEPVRVQSTALLCGVRSAYTEPERLGVDRLLGLVAAHAAGHAPCVLASLGTALTLDVLDGEARHRGGLIVASPGLMQQSVLAAAGRVESRAPGRMTWFAITTEDALASGAWLAAAALVERFCEEAAGLLGVSPHLLLAGGDAARLGAHLRRPSQPFPDAVLRGLAHCADVPEGTVPPGTAREQ